MDRRRLSILVLAVLLLGPPNAAAQIGSGRSVSGIVLKPDGTARAGLTVQLRHSQVGDSGLS